MNEREAKFVNDILASADRIEGLIDDGRERFDSSSDQRDIAERRLEIIGEASSRLVAAGFLERHPDLPLIDAKDQRNFIAHEYDRLDYDVIWRTMAISVPQLAAALRAISEDPDDSDR